ncbi:MAG: TRAP transporter TatT component family protein [Vicinamibacterales bacterium]
MPARTRLELICLLSVLLLPLSGCSLRKMAVRTMADALSQGASTFGTDEDPELVKEALPFGLKTLESLVVELPTHRPLLRAVSSGFTQYAVGFLQPELRVLEIEDFEQARAQRVRIRKLLLRARDYGLRALEVEYPGLREALNRDPKLALARTVRDDVPDLYWTAAAWGSAISLGKSEPGLILEVPTVEALIKRALTLDEGWDAGAIHEFLIAFESRGEASGGSLERARTHFQRAVELARGRRVSPYVSFAENVCVQTQNRKEFEELLQKALDYDPDAHLETRLANVLSQRRARQLLAMAGDLFLEEQK